MFFFITFVTGLELVFYFFLRWLAGVFFLMFLFVIGLEAWSSAGCFSLQLGGVVQR